MQGTLKEREGKAKVEKRGLPMRESCVCIYGEREREKERKGKEKERE